MKNTGVFLTVLFPTLVLCLQVALPGVEWEERYFFYERNSDREE